MRKNIRKLKFAIFLFSLFTCYFFSWNNIGYSSTFYQFQDDFETGSLDPAWYAEVAESYSGNIVNTIAATGNYSFRSELHKDDPDVYGSKRAEIGLTPEKPLEEHWYSMKIYLPAEGDENYADDVDWNPESLVQWHNIPDEGEEYISPPLGLVTMQGNYYLFRFWDDAQITSNQRMFDNGTYSVDNLGSFENDKGKWVQWVFHIKWGWAGSQNPILEVYKDGNMVINLNGLPNCFNDKSGVYMKVGLHKWGWAQYPEKSILNKRIVYYDDVKISASPDDDELLAYQNSINFHYEILNN